MQRHDRAIYASSKRIQRKKVMGHYRDIKIKPTKYLGWQRHDRAIHASSKRIQRKKVMGHYRDIKIKPTKYLGC